MTESGFLIAARIVAARKNAGLTQTDLALALGVTFQQIQKYEKGTNRVTADRLVDVARATAKSIEYFYADVRTDTRGATNDDISALVKLMGGSKELRRIVAILPKLSREDAEHFAALMERVAS